MVRPEVPVALMVLSKYYRLIHSLIPDSLSGQEGAVNFNVDRASHFISMSKKAPISPLSLLHLSSLHLSSLDPWKKLHDPFSNIFKWGIIRREKTKDRY